MLRFIVFINMTILSKTGEKPYNKNSSNKIVYILFWVINSYLVLWLRGLFKAINPTTKILMSLFFARNVKYAWKCGKKIHFY